MIKPTYIRKFTNYKCEGCGKCCINVKVNLSKDDLTKLDPSTYIKNEDKFILKTKKIKNDEYCIFLDVDTLKCTNYDNRPTICKKFEYSSDYCFEIKTLQHNMKKSGINYPYITGFTIDPNEYCNAKCWWCPNGYRNQKESIMPLNEIEIIIDKILEEKGNIVDPELDTMYFHHFNEILLYPYFEDLIKLLRTKGLKTHLFSNGVALTPEKYDFCIEYKDVIRSINLNVPSIEKDVWKNHMRMKDYDFDQLIKNLNYLHDNSNIIYVGIEVNGMSKESYLENGGNITKLKNFPENIDDDLDYQFDKIKEKYPNFNTFLKFHYLCDWNGYLENKKIISNTIYNLLHIKKDNENVLDCNCYNRAYNYLEINSRGDVYFCLDDIDFKTVYGNLLIDDLNQIWNSDRHKEIVKKETTTGLCSRCNAGIWE